MPDCNREGSVEPAARAVPDWWRKEEEGGGWLGAYCSHIIDQIRVSGGEFTGVSASVQIAPPAVTLRSESVSRPHSAPRQARLDSSVTSLANAQPPPPSGGQSSGQRAEAGSSGK